MKYVDRKTKFKTLAVQAGLDEQNVCEVIIPILECWGFFEAPASTKYHGAYEGGLFDHSYEVAKTLMELTDSLKLQWLNSTSPFVVGMFHDLCKCGCYERDLDGKWMHVEQTLPGHGDKSVMKAITLVPLNDEEIHCIRWHMGAYEKDPAMWNIYGRAIEKYPNVLWTHTADMVASRIKGV